jgi:hypothetical protein
VDDEPRARGLPSIEEARKARGKLRWPPAKFWGYTGLILAITFILHWKWTQGEIEHGRQELMARQRAVAVQLGPRWNPLRDKLEGWTLALAKDAAPDVVDLEALKAWDFRSKAGIYLRMRVDEAKTAESIRKGAKNSLRDGFTSCMMTYPNPNALGGMECKRTRDCPAGEFCNESDHCARAAQPFNLRVAYRTMHVLSDEWVRDVQEAGTDIRVRLLSSSFDDTIRDDVPLAADLLTRAQYFLLVLDETPPNQPAPGDGGAPTAEELQGIPHTARVAVWRISDDKQLLRVRREAGGELLGGVRGADSAVNAAAKRQANSCALALAVRQAIGDVNVPSVAPSP